MAKKNNRKCVCCGLEYRYCNTCAEDVGKPQWYAIYHDENCRGIFKTVSDYLGNTITKEEAKVKLDACDLSKKEDLKPSIVAVINDIYNTTENKVVEEIVEKPSVEISEEISDEKNTSVKKTKKK